MDPESPGHGCERQPFEFNETNIQRLSDKYSQEMKDDPENPIKVCMKLIYEAAIEKEPAKCNQLSLKFSQFLIQQDGVINLFLALIDFDTSSQKTTTHNQRFIAVSNIISCLPKLCVDYATYCNNIFSQLKHLLINKNTKYSSLASIIIRSLIDSPHAKDKNIPQIILNPILRTLQAEHSNYEMKPAEAILAINSLLSNHILANGDSHKLFVHIFPNLFFALNTLYDSPSRLKPLLTSCLVIILNELQPGPACCLLEETLFYSQDKKNLYSRDVQDEEISLKFADKPHGISTDHAYHEQIAISLIEESNNQNLFLEFFFHFQSKLWTTHDEEVRSRCTALVEPLLEQTIQERSSRLDLLSIITTNRKRSIELIRRTLLNYVGFLRSSQNSIEPMLMSSSISSCLNILEVLVVNLGDESEIISLRQRILPILEEMKELVASDSSSGEKLDDSLRWFIGRLTAVEFRRGDSEGGLSRRVKSEYDTVIEELNDKLVPVRVHALVRLKQLVMANDQITINRLSQLYDLIESSLADQEPYVFLASINLLAEMSLRKTNEILPKLVDIHARKDLEVQQRINAGEVLVRLARRMNKTAPYYAQQVMNMLMKGALDPDELMRMSSLTSLGGMCENLGDSLGKYIVDILSCVSKVINDDTIAAKCAAVDLLRHALLGLNKSTVESIQHDLGSIYKLLKDLKLKTVDAQLDLQVELALDEIDRLARGLLGLEGNNEGRSGSDFVKSIRVLSLLDS